NQYIPLIEPKEQNKGTSIEYVSSKDSGAAIISEHDGIVESVEAKEIAIRKISEVDGKEVEGDLVRYGLRKYIRSNQGTCYNQRPIVSNRSEERRVEKE